MTEFIQPSNWLAQLQVDLAAVRKMKRRLPPLVIGDEASTFNKSPVILSFGDFLALHQVGALSRPTLDKLSSVLQSLFPETPTASD